MLKTLPLFPLFRPLTIGDRIAYNRYTANFDPYSDFNFTSLLCWGENGKSEISNLNGNLVIRMPSYIGNEKIYSILGNKDIDSSFEDLFKVTTKLELLPEITIKSLKDHSKYRIIESPDNHDYIYDLSTLTTLSGQSLKKHRNKLNKFLIDHNDFKLETRITTVFTDEIKKLIINLDHEWSLKFSRESGDIRAEKQAIELLLKHTDKINLFLVIIYVNEVPKGFSINELLPNGYAICHFEKALKSTHNYIGTYLVKEVARALHQYGAKLVNWEQDLGLEGLRNSKKSYLPIKFLYKYSVRQS